LNVLFLTQLARAFSGLQKKISPQPFFILWFRCGTIPIAELMMCSLNKLHFATQFFTKTNMTIEKIQPFEGVSPIKDYIGVFSINRHVCFRGGVQYDFPRSLQQIRSFWHGEKSTPFG